MIQSLPDAEHRNLKLTELNEVVKLCIKPECRKVQLEKYFGDSDTSECQKWDFCVDAASVDKTEANMEAVEVLKCLQTMNHLHPKITFNSERSEVNKSVGLSRVEGPSVARAAQIRAKNIFLYICIYR